MKKTMAYYIKATYGILCDRVGRISRKRWRNKLERKKLSNENFSIFSQNCIGTIMYHDLDLQFRTPTVNLLFSPRDFIVFMENLTDNLQHEIEFIRPGNLHYPVGKLGGITIHFLHYKTEKEAKESWNKRKERINWNNIFVICCDKGLTYDDVLRFDALPYDHKILFVSKQYSDIPCSVYCKKFRDYTDARLIGFKNPLGKRIYSDYIDYIGWLNRKDLSEIIIENKRKRWRLV